MNPWKQGLLLAACLLSTSLLAHTDEYLDTQKTPNGGQMRMAGPVHLELVVARDSDGSSDKPVRVYVTDHGGNPVSTAGASATATLLGSKGKASVTLRPEGDNRLQGLGRYVASPDLKVVVAVTLAGKPVEQARFTPLAGAPAAHGGAHAGH